MSNVFITQPSGALEGASSVSPGELLQGYYDTGTYTVDGIQTVLNKINETEGPRYSAYFVPCFTKQLKDGSTKVPDANGFITKTLRQNGCLVFFTYREMYDKIAGTKRKVKTIWVIVPNEDDVMSFKKQNGFTLFFLRRWVPRQDEYDEVKVSFSSASAPAAKEDHDHAKLLEKAIEEAELFTRQLDSEYNPTNSPPVIIMAGYKNAERETWPLFRPANNHAHSKPCPGCRGEGEGEGACPHNSKVFTAPAKTFEEFTMQVRGACIFNHNTWGKVFGENGKNAWPFLKMLWGKIGMSYLDALQAKLKSVQNRQAVKERMIPDEQGFKMTKSSASSAVDAEPGQTSAPKKKTNEPKQKPGGAFDLLAIENSGDEECSTTSDEDPSTQQVSNAASRTPTPTPPRKVTIRLRKISSKTVKAPSSKPG